MDTFEKLISELKGKLKEAKSGDKPSLFGDKVRHVCNLIQSYRKRLESIERNMLGYLEEKEKSKESRKEKMFEGFVQSMSISRTDILTLIDKGWNYIATGDYANAEKILELALSNAPDNIQVMKLLGWAYMYDERYDEALLLYQKVLNSVPNDAMARNNLGYICYKKEIFGEAIEHLSRVIKEGKDVNATLYANHYLGLVYFEREMFEDAIHFFTEALEIGPNLMEAKYYLGLSYYGEGEKQNARKIWKEMIEDNPNNRWSELAKKKLKKAEAEKRLGEN